MGVDLQFDPGDLFRIIQAFDQLHRRGGDMRPALTSIGEDVYDVIQDAFEFGRSPWGEQWEPLSDTTLAKPGRGDQAQILIDTGRLRGSFQVAQTPDGVEVGTNVVYAAMHQFGARKGEFGTTRRGAPIPWGDVPARPFLPLDGEQFDPPPALANQILATLQGYLLP